MFLGTPPPISVGASGGIMGLGAFLFSLALLRAPIGLKLNTKNLGFVMAINLLMGFAVDGIDKAGHIGVALVGFIFGW
ncbi:rhomboid family intramembrane serine protease, partial [Moraxella catarrhalis]|uniref:rhomboid family intramembrane serine protease n=1 Tax=Moraxella catarrhalis TaxID=480 RepID=UPI0030CE01F8